MEKTLENLSDVKKRFSRIGLAAFTILGAGTLFQVLTIVVADLAFPQWPEHPWGMWLVTFAPLYILAYPLGILLIRKVPATPLKQRSFRVRDLLTITLISIFMMYAGNIAGNIINALLQSVLGVPAENPLVDLTMGTALLPKLLVMVIIAPIIEEYVFRKQMIDRMHIYGEKTAVLVSALMFGLFHGNLSQFFYAFALGLMFGYVYLKTSKLRYSIGLHMLINSMGGVIAPTLMEHIPILEDGTADLTSPWLAAYGAYVIVLIGLSVAGLVLLCIHQRRVSFAPAEQELPKSLRFKTVWLNRGMILFVLLCAAMFVINAVFA